MGVVKNMSQDEFKKYLSTTKEDSYVLVDVREPEEYEEEHMPGAVLLPLKDVETGILEFDPHKDFIFYCLSGKRSGVAASLVADMGIISGNIYKLEGGILYWEGKDLAGYPRLKVVDVSEGPLSVLKKGMDLEKGAEIFYKRCAAEFEDSKLSEIAELLAGFELAHAKTIYSILKRLDSGVEDFDSIYNSLTGDIIEGGMSVEEAVNRLMGMEGDRCLNLCEMALEIEYMAYDLYKNIAAREKDVELVKIMYELSQQEKLHISSVSKMFSRCAEKTTS